MKTKATVNLKDLTPAEIKLVKQSLRGAPVSAQVDHSSFYGDRIRFGYYSDPHCGEKHFSENLWRGMIAFFTAQGIKQVYCPGDKQICHLISLYAGNPLENYVLDYIT